MPTVPVPVNPWWGSRQERDEQPPAGGAATLPAGVAQGPAAIDTGLAGQDHGEDRGG